MITLAELARSSPGPIDMTGMRNPCAYEDVYVTEHTRFVSEYEEEVLRWVKENGGLEAVQTAFMNRRVYGD